MVRRMIPALICAAMLASFCVEAWSEERAFGRNWGSSLSAQDWERFYHYPYVYYPHNFYGSEYFRSSNSMYHRYPQEMRIPAYNRNWHNYYPNPRPYHQGHHFVLDVF